MKLTQVKKINQIRTCELLKTRSRLLNLNQERSQHFRNITEEIIRRLNLSLKTPIDSAEITNEIRKRAKNAR